jgi:tetratricopeptide (TPR) repeat protein
MKFRVFTFVLHITCLLVYADSSGKVEINKPQLQATNIPLARKLVQGRSVEVFYHPKLKKTILINGILDLAPWHTKFIELWQWNNGNWELLSDSGPEVRNTFGWAYDDLRNVLIIYGGSVTTEPGKRKTYSDTWEWNGKDWRKIETPVNPGNRIAQGMVYDPHRRATILFGGINDKLEGMGDTWAYDGTAWKQIFSDGPSGRWPATMFYYPKTKRVYVYGGISRKKFSDQGGNMDDTWELSENGWKEIHVSVTPGIREHTTTIFDKKTNKIWMLAGSGVTPETKFLNSIWSFDGIGWRRENIKGLPPRDGHGVSYDPETKNLMVVGGFNVGGGSRLTDIWLLDSKKNEWICLSDCLNEILQKVIDHPDDINTLLNYVATLFWTNEDNTLREFISKSVMDDRMPRNSYRRLGAYLITVKKYSESIQCYQRANEMEPQGGDYYNTACAFALMNFNDKAFEAMNKAFEYGYNSRQSYENDTDLVSLKSDSRWAAFMKKLDAQFEGSTPYKRAHHELVYDETNKSILMVGGSTPLNNGQRGKFFNDIWNYTDARWSKVANVGDERSGIRLVYDTKRNNIYSFGGFTSDNQSSGQLRLLEDGAWKILTDVPEMKAAESGFVYDDVRDKLIAFGGTAGRDIVNNTTWEWDGGQWKRFDGQSPEGRSAFAMVYDSKRNRTVLYGGRGRQQIFDDTWEFDGVKWTKVSTEGPGARGAFGFAYDSKRGMLMIFGGLGPSGAKGDTWGWDGSKWKKLSETGPSPRMMGYMAYDKARDRAVMFGGRLGWPNDAADTWEWDGNQWEEIKEEE